MGGWEAEVLECCRGVSGPGSRGRVGGREAPPMSVIACPRTRKTGDRQALPSLSEHQDPSAWGKRHRTPSRGPRPAPQQARTCCRRRPLSRRGPGAAGPGPGPPPRWATRRWAPAPSAGRPRPRRAQRGRPASAGAASSGRPPPPSTWGTRAGRHRGYRFPRGQT